MTQLNPNHISIPPIIRSCLNCIHLKMWYFPATREDPGDEGMECGNEEGAWWTIESDPVSETVEAECQYTASQCDLWEYYNWRSHYEAQAESEADYFAALEEANYL